MNDFEYDCYVKKNIANSAKKKVGQRKGCTLPSDYLTEAEKKKLSGPVEVVADMTKPIRYAYFKLLSKEDQERYINYLITTFNVTYIDIAKMMGVDRTNLTKYCNIRKLNVLVKQGRKSSMSKSDRLAWNQFCGVEEKPVSMDIPTAETIDVKPTTYEHFKEFDQAAKQHYIDVLHAAYGASISDIAVMLGTNEKTLRSHLCRCDVRTPGKRGLKMPDKMQPAWEAFCGKSEESMDIVKSIDIEEPAETKPVFEEPTMDIAEGTTYEVGDQVQLNDEKYVCTCGPEGEGMLNPEDALPYSCKYNVDMVLPNPTSWEQVFAILGGMPLPENVTLRIFLSVE